MVTGVIPSPPRFLPSIFIAHRVQQSHCSSIVHRMLLTHALELSASQFVHKKKSQRIYTSMHSAGLELTKLTYTSLEDNNLVRHRGDRFICDSLTISLTFSLHQLHPLHQLHQFHQLHLLLYRWWCHIQSLSSQYPVSIQSISSQYPVCIQSKSSPPGG